MSLTHCGCRARRCTPASCIEHAALAPAVAGACCGPNPGPRGAAGSPRCSPGGSNGIPPATNDVAGRAVGTATECPPRVASGLWTTGGGGWRDTRARICDVQCDTAVSAASSCGMRPVSDATTTHACTGRYLFAGDRCRRRINPRQHLAE